MTGSLQHPPIKLDRICSAILDGSSMTIVIFLYIFVFASNGIRDSKFDRVIE